MSQNNWNTTFPPIIVNGSNFSSIWNKVRKWLSVLNYSVTTPAPTQKDWRKFEGTCYWKVTSSLPIYNKNTSSTIVYDQGANRQRKFILVLLGASFVLIELLFTKIHLLVCIWYAWNQHRIYLFQRFAIRCYTVLNRLSSSSYQLLSLSLEVSYHNTLVWTIYYLYKFWSIFGNAIFCRRMKVWYWWWSRIIKFFIYNCLSVSGRIPFLGYQLL